MLSGNTWEFVLLEETRWLESLSCPVTRGSRRWEFGALIPGRAALPNGLYRGSVFCHIWLG